MNARNRFRRAFLLISIVILALSFTIPSKAGQIKAQPRKGTTDKSARPNKPAPTYADVSYGPSNSNKLDFWQVKSRKAAPLLVFIHGGGFRGGSKNSIPPELLTKCLEAGISFASIDYRLSGEAIYPAQMHDCARAILFIRSKAAVCKIDL